MTYLLFLGRHLVNTRFQEKYLARILSTPPDRVTGLVGGAVPADSPTGVLFAITSANQENSRFNPIPFHIRAVGVDRFARRLQAHAECRYRVFGIPHYGHTTDFAAFTLKEIAHQSERGIRLTPNNCLVVCSTPEVIRLYQALGFSIAPAESRPEKSRVATPIEIVREAAERGASWRSGALVTTELAPSHLSLFEDFPEVPQRISRLYQDPLTNQDGSLTDTRDYSTYARGMNEIVRLKYLDIRDAIKPGRLVGGLEYPAASEIGTGHIACHMTRARVTQAPQLFRAPSFIGSESADFWPRNGLLGPFRRASKA